MATQKADREHQRKPKADEGASRRAAENASPLEDPEFFKKVTAALQQRGGDKRVLLNIPVWGWTGDGKTCGLLTALHFCEPPEHPLGFALVSNTEELAELEAATDEYRGMSLAAAGAASNDRLRGLSQTFIDGSEWPPGTDEPTLYIVAIRSVSSTLGFALFPDLRGGSYREVDDAARAALRTAHAAIVLVNPELYQSRSTDAKRYRDEITAQLQRFASAGIPTCVMITKADRHKGANEATDVTHQQLTMIVGSQKEFNALVCRVSVVGADKDLLENALPPVEERNPEQLVKAWIWVVSEALKRPAADIRALAPSLDLRAPNLALDATELTAVAELRRVGDFSDSLGSVLCETSEDPRSTAFAFISEDGELSEATLGSEPSAPPTTRNIGKAADWDASDARLQAQYVSGQLMVAPRRQVNHLWAGAKGAVLQRTALPVEMVSWTSAGTSRLVALDATGRLHSLRLEGAKWVQTDFLEGFIAASNFLACAVLRDRSTAMAFNGSACSAVALSPDGRFGTRLNAGLKCAYDTDNVVATSTGSCFALTAANVLLASGNANPLEIGPVEPKAAAVSFAAAADAPVGALVGPGLRLTAFALADERVIKSGKTLSPAIPSPPESLAWSRRGDVLVVVFEDNTWSVFRPYGLIAR